MDFLFLGERLAIDLLNTVIAADGHRRDLLERPRDIAAWTKGARIADAGGAAGSDRGLRELKTFREALRRGLVTWAETGRPTPGLVRLINARLSRDPEVAEVRVSTDAVVLERKSIAPAGDRLYGAVARSVADLLANGDSRRLRKCGSPQCLLMFYDVSKAGRRRWCSMQTCGAHAKVRAFRKRRRSRARS